MVTSYLCNSSSILWRCGGAFARFFMAIISSGLWSLSATWSSFRVDRCWNVGRQRQWLEVPFQCWHTLSPRPWDSCWQRRSAGPFSLCLLYEAGSQPPQRSIRLNCYRQIPVIISEQMWCIGFSQLGSWLAERTEFVDHPNETHCHLFEHRPKWLSVMWEVWNEGPHVVYHT